MTNKNHHVIAFILGTVDQYRGNELEKKLSSLPLEFRNIWGLDYRNNSRDEIERFINRKLVKFLIHRQLTLGEICCAKGHLEIYCRFLETKSNWALILEDDAELAVETIPLSMLNLLKDDNAAIIQLHGIKEIVKPFGIKIKALESKTLPKENKLLRLYFIPQSTQAYLINRNAAIRLVNATSRGIHSTADWPILGLRGVRFYSTRSPIFQLGSQGSLLDENRKLTIRKLSNVTLKIRLLEDLIGLKALKGIFHGVNIFDLYYFSFWTSVSKILCKLGPKYLVREVGTIRDDFS